MAILNALESGALDITSSLSTLTSLFTWGIQTVTSNSVILAIFVASLAGVGFGLIRKAKSAVK